MFKTVSLAFLVVFAGLAIAQVPVAQLPRVYIDSTYALPTGGTTWAAHTAAQFSSAIKTASPGDVIVLDAGVTYSGNFVLPAKANSNNKWIYVISSALAKMPAGQRVSPALAANMPKIVTPNVAPAIQINGGANHWRLAGLEITSASTQGCQPTHSPAINCFTYFLVGPQNGAVTPEPDSFAIDRCYIHGSPTIDLQRAVLANASNFAVVDSYLDDIHMIGVEAQGILAYYSPGPFKFVNNYIAAATENILFGGAGGAGNPYIASDLEIRKNYLFKPLSWVAASVTQHTMVVKNALELKSAQRVLVDGNTMENVWANGQNGFAIVLTVRSYQSGDISVVNDITVTNNLLKNVVAGFNTLAQDDVCGTSTGPNCHNAGSQTRWNIANNLILFYDPTALGGLRNVGIMLNGGQDRINGHPGVPRDIVFQHNTLIPAPGHPCWNSIFFSDAPVQNPDTQNIWLLDNVFCRQPSGDNGWQGTTGLNAYMGLPSASPYDLTQRFYGNVMLVQSGDKVQVFPPHNYATTLPFTYVNSTSGNYQLVNPNWTDTKDGKIAGINYSALSQALATNVIVAGPGGSMPGSPIPQPTNTVGGGTIAR